MSVGLSEFGGVMAPPDVGFGAGPEEWTSVSGIKPTHPLVGGPEWAPYSPVDADWGRGRVVTQHADGVPTEVHQHWSDLFNWRHSPMPWVALAALAVLGLMALRVEGRVGPYKVAAGVGK